MIKKFEEINEFYDAVGTSDMEGKLVDPELGDRYFANKLLDYQRKPVN